MEQDDAAGSAAGNFGEAAGSDIKARFETLMREEGPRVYTLAARLTGNLADGQDLAAETFVRAFKAFGAFRGESTAGTWLYRICMNLWKNRLRSQKRRHFWSHFSLDAGRDEEAAPLELPSLEPGMDKPLEEAERRRRVEVALDRLSPEDRSIVILRDTEDKSYEAIAALLGVPLGTVKSRLARARLKLRDLLKDAL